MRIEAKMKELSEEQKENEIHVTSMNTNPIISLKRQWQSYIKAKELESVAYRCSIDPNGIYATGLSKLFYEIHNTQPNTEKEEAVLSMNRAECEEHLKNSIKEDKFNILWVKCLVITKQESSVTATTLSQLKELTSTYRTRMSRGRKE